MPLLEKRTYRPPILLRNGHTNTVMSALGRRAGRVPYRRSVIRTRDDDILVVDRWVKGRPRLAVLCHGLEGSSRSSYIRSMARVLQSEGFDILAMNFRSCGGLMNYQPRMYHSGETADLHTLLNYYQDAYQYIILVGFSLGGNVILKYLGENPTRVHHKVRAAIAVSVPTDLRSSAKKISRRSNYLYQEMFLRSLFDKVRKKKQQFPDKIDLSLLGRIKSLMDFDEFFTAPMHGFKNAEDYYDQCHSGQFLFDIEIPTLLINAQDDPFLTESCFPGDLARHSDALFFDRPQFGGHVGFFKWGRDYHEERALEFLRQHTPTKIEIQGESL